MPRWVNTKIRGGGNMRCNLILLVLVFATVWIIYFQQQHLLLAMQPKANSIFDDESLLLPLSPESLTIAPKIRIPDMVAKLDVNRDIHSANQALMLAPAQPGVHIITSFFRGTYSVERFHEILYCLRRNLGNAATTAVHVLYEDIDPATFLNETSLGDDVLLQSLVSVKFPQQPTYKDFFQYANRFLNSTGGVVAVLVNSDSYFDGTLHCMHTILNKRADRNRLVYSLSRHPSIHLDCPRPGKNLCDKYRGSHDGFAFEPPLPLSLVANVDFYQNNMGAENVVLYEFSQLKKYVVLNPCHQIVLYHAHCSRERSYSSEVRIDRGKGRIGDHDRHSFRNPSAIICPGL